MKRFAVFTLFLLNSAGPATACGYYPFGEELRFSIFDPRAFGFAGYERFVFTSHAFAPVASDTMPGYIDEGKAMNIALWRKRSNVLFSDSVICEAVYSDRVSPGNAFVKHLYERKDFGALGYLNFARECTGLSDALADPWERNADALSNRRGGYIQVALDRADTCRDQELRLRYAFQAIRMAFYNRDYATVKTVYASFFGQRTEKNILDYWALHFRTLAEPAGPEKNYYAAQVFANAPDKRYASYCCYDRTVAVKDALQFAKTDHEKAAVWFLEGVRRYGRALECMQHINALEPGSEWVDFLLARELNKLEDRIYTPSYAYFTPAMEEEGMSWPWGISVQNVARRVQGERAYAQLVLNFSRQAPAGNKAFRETCEGYLLFMTMQYPEALAQTRVAAKSCKGDPARSTQVQLIRSLCLVAVQDSGAVIPEEVKPVLLQQHRQGGQRFILAVARELEFSGNTTDAALLLMKLNPDQQNWEKMLFWGTEEVHPFTYTYATEYFDYLDSKYTTTQLVAVIADVRRPHEADTFSSWKYREAEKEVPRLYDLLGTKYLRLDRLQKALEAFEKVNDTLWKSSHQPFKTYLAANPFYANMYSGHAPTAADTIAYDKESITRTLIGYLAKAEDTTNIHRHYYYFLAANCYFNMTQYGNSWMMKRYYWSMNSVRSGMPDSKDYFDCDKAKAYYEKARLLSKSKKFAALCLRMAARCEGYRLRHEAALKEDENFSAGKYVNVEPKKNTYYRKLEKKYPDYADDLISNCYSFDEYFKTWK